MDDNGLHRPPVLLQSADDQDHHYYSDRFGQQRHLSQPHVGLSHPSGDDMPFPSHVHTKDCRDVCPDQDLYTETSFIRFNKGMRTNIYGLAVVEELCSKEGLNTDSILDNEDSRNRQQQNQQRSQLHHRAETLKGTPISNTSATTNDASSSSESASATTVSSQSKTMFADRIGRYVLVASSGLVTCYMGMDRSSEISLGPNQEVVSIDTYESACQGGFRVVMSIAIARAEETGTQFEMLFYGARTCAKSVIDHILSFPYTNDIQRIPINWAPTKILHVPITMDLSKTAILVGGGDTKVHSFIKGHDGNIAEEPIEDYFPVLTTFHHSHNW
ncbi:hypothetical protein BGW42_006448 [Actinomortierella wolfii]|nr:hypothetical protein BGW42_006448 [Actinomortierella wolfii]